MFSKIQCPTDRCTKCDNNFLDIQPNIKCIELPMQSLFLPLSILHEQASTTMSVIFHVPFVTVHLIHTHKT